MITSIVVGIIAFNLGFLVGAFWVSAKNADAREYARQDARRWLHHGLR